MSLITRCPACGTMFKVVADQLRISEGWVRCGHCAEIFDATASLQEPEAAAAAEAEPAPPPSPLESPPAAPSPAAASPPLPPVPEAAVPMPITRPAPIEPESEGVDSIAAPPLYPSFPSEVRDSYIDSKSLREEPELDDVPFVRQARRKAVWRRPAVRALLLLLAVLLAGLLALQYAVQEHDKLAATRPALRPLLQALCEPLHCRVGPPRQIDAIVIDSSSFSRLRSDAYRLTFSLRNQAAMPVAMPALELTLTDTQDQPVIRRVLEPAQLDAAAAIPAGSEATTSIALAVAANGSSARVAGYRLLAFYP